MLQTFTRLLFLVCGFSPVVLWAQPANNDCAGALPAAVSAGGACSFFTVNTTGATYSGADPGPLFCAATSANDDVWYSFTATAANVTLTFRNVAATSGTVSGVGYAIYDGCGGTRLTCFASSPATNVGVRPTLSAPLTVGNTYFLRLWAGGGTNSATFDVCLSTPLDNDDCGGALPFTVSTAAAGCTFTTVSTATATQTAFTTSCTAASNTDDVWFSFVAPSANLLIRYQSYVVTGGASSGLGYSIHNGCSGTEVACDFTFGNASTGFQYLDPATPLTPGATYFIRLYAQGANNTATFGLCLQEVTLPDIAAKPSNTCVSGSVTLDGTGGSLPALDPSGDVIAFIQNSQALGVTSVSIYGNDGPLRTFGPTSARYLDRNITISPTVQPTSQVTVGIPVPIGEISTFFAANGSQAFADYQWVRNPTTSCSPTFNGAGVPQPFSGVFFYPGGYLFETNVAAFSEFFMVPTAAPLPVELTRFAARAEGARNVIEWSAATEQDLATYTVERADGADFARATAVASVAPRGTSTGVEAIYTAYDEAPARVSYYRLKAVDLDGSVDYSDVVAVTRTVGPAGVKMYPNPSRAGGATTIALAGVDENAGLDVSVTDAAGRQVAQVRYTADGAYELPLGGLPAGMYTVTAVTGASVHTERLVIE